MAIRVRAQLRKWFGRGMYPTAEQFSDLFDSFFHKTEDKIPMSGVEGLTDQLNGKYSTAEGRELEKKVQKVTTDLSAHVASSEKAFNEVQNDIEALDGRLDDEIERAKGEEAAIRRELAAGDAATLSSAKSYTDTSVAAEAGKREQGDATTLQAAKTYTDTSVADEAQKRGQGDAATLQSANSHADAAVASEKSARESGDRTTLESAKAYVDKAIAELVDGSPAALDTLKELSAALGNDPNFATTVATQIGQKVDKVAGKGLSTEDYTPEEKAKLAGVAAGANNYQHPATHPATMIEQDASHRFLTDTEIASLHAADDNLRDRTIAISASLQSASEWEIEDTILTARTVDGSTFMTTSNASSSLAPTEAWIQSANRTVRLRVENQGVSSFVSVPVAIVSSSDSTLAFYGSIYAYETRIDVSIVRNDDAWTTNAEVADFAARLNIFAEEKSFTDLVNSQNVDRLKWIIVQLVDPDSSTVFDLNVISKNWSNLDATDFESVPLPMEYRAVFGAFQQSSLFGSLQMTVRSDGNDIMIDPDAPIIPDRYVDFNMIMDGAITSGKIADGAITTWKIASKAVASHHINDKAIELRHLSDELSDKFTVSPSGSPLHDLFVAAGAVWNDAAKNWTVGLVEGISTDKMAAIYADTNGRLRGNNWDSALYRAGSSTNFPPRTLPISLMVGNIDATSAFSASSLEIVQLTTQNKEPLSKVKFSSINMIFTNCSKLKEVIGVMDVSSCSSATNAFQACILLQRVNISGLSVNLSLSSTSQLSLDSLQYLVDNAKNTSAITVTVHADIYAKLTDPADTEWYAVNEAAQAKQISFATV